MAGARGGRVGSVQERAVDFQVRLQEVLARVEADTRQELAPRPLGPYLTISRQTGSDGAEVARRVGEDLGWPVLDKELVELLAERLKVSPKLVELLDETRPNLLRDDLVALMEPGQVAQDRYVATLGKVVLLAAYDGPVVVVGRGASFFLPPSRGLRVRLIAPRAFRLEHVGDEHGLDERAAARFLEDSDAGRVAFVKRHFNRDIDDPRHYDLILDVSAFGIPDSARLISRALALRGFTG